ncbi:MAG: RNA polymerase sigma factor [Verrucomicrobiota bacterium]
MNAPELFETIVSDYHAVLFRFALSLTRAPADAEDLTQQTFCTWAQKGHQLRDRSKVKTWLFTTMHRAFLAARKRQTRFPHHRLEAVIEELPPAEPLECADRADPSQALAALAEVDEVYQTAVALFYLEDLSYEEIARVLQIPLGTVKSRLSRGIMQLRKILLPDGTAAEPTSVESAPGRAALRRIRRGPATEGPVAAR